LRRRPGLAAGVILLAAGHAAAETPPVDVRADDVVLDGTTRELELSGNVRVDAAPFHLSSERLRIWRSSRGVRVRGDGRLAFCPCLGNPLTIEFKGATVAPPGDLLLDRPRLEIYHVPVLWLPVFWLRSPGNVGLLPAEIAYRGADGLFVGAGVHVPWVRGDTTNGLDLRGGAYLLGGFDAEARLRTDVSTTRLRVDDLRGQAGVSADARGAVVAAAGPTVAWDVDALRGTRAVVATTELDAAARVFDRASAEVTWRDGGWTASTGARLSGVRGSSVADVGAAGPVVALRRGEALGTSGAYDVRLEGGAIGGLSTMSFARTGGGVLLAGSLGDFAVATSVRGVADAATIGRSQGLAPALGTTASDGVDAAAVARAELSLPVGRAFESSDPGDPWLHKIEPRVAVSATASHGDSLFGLFPGAGSPTFSSGGQGAAWVAEGGLGTSLGRWGAREGLELGADAGAVGNGHAETPSPVVGWRAAASGVWASLGAEGAHVLAVSGGDAGGLALAARGRLGLADGLHVSALVAGRDGVDPVVARALTDAPLEPSSGFLATPGWTGGARVGLPLGRSVMTQAGADVDLTTGQLLATRGSVAYRDRCGCFAVRALAAERVGRAGVDVWVTIDLAPNP